MVTLGIGYITTGFGVLITRGNPVVIIDWTFRQLSIGKLGFYLFPLFWHYFYSLLYGFKRKDYFWKVHFSHGWR